MRKLIASVFATGVLAVGIGAPAASAQPIVTGGVVNITVVDSLNNVLSNNNVAVGLALGLGANVCDVNVNVLAVQLSDDEATCTNTVTGQEVTITQSQ
jgi:hypothetical protein